MVLEPLTREGNGGRGKALGEGVRNHGFTFDKWLEALIKHPRTHLEHNRLSKNIQ